MVLSKKKRNMYKLSLIAFVLGFPGGLPMFICFVAAIKYLTTRFFFLVISEVATIRINGCFLLLLCSLLSN